MAQSPSRGDDSRRKATLKDSEALSASEGAYIGLFLKEIDKNTITFHSRLCGTDNNDDIALVDDDKRAMKTGTSI